MFWSRAAPCRFLHLARERSSITAGIVQAETPPPPLQSSLFQLPCSFPARKLPKEQPHCGYETQRLLPLHRGNLVPSAPCQAQLTDPFHTRLMLLHAEWRGTKDTGRITTQRAVGDWGSLRGERGGQEAALPMFPSNMHMSLMPVLMSKNCLQLFLWWEETDPPNRKAT